MTITIQIPSALRACCDGATEISVAATTVRAALDTIEREQPSLYTSICDETGAVRRHVNLFINSALVREASDFDSPLAPGDVVSIFQAVSGG